MCAYVAACRKRNSVINTKTICIVYEYHPTKCGLCVDNDSSNGLATLGQGVITHQGAD